MAGLAVAGEIDPDCCYAGRIEICRGGWEEFAFLGLDHLLGLAQGGRGGLQVGIGDQRLLNQGIELGPTGTAATIHLEYRVH